jgi:CubicO group peptidase (beta-lactamase class C family)
MSVTKSVVGVLAGIVVEEGRLNLEALVTSYVPEVKGTIWEGATVRNVLDMSVAFQETRDNFDRLDEAAGWLPRRADSVDGLHAYLKTLTMKTGQHGEAFRYAAENTDLMGWILERATGMDFAALMSKELWSKLGAERDAYILLDRFQTAYTDCGMNVTLRDLGRFAEMMMQNGLSNGQRVVSDEWIQDIRQNGDPKAWRNTGFAKWSNYKNYQNGSYRSYWYVSDSPVGRYMAIGLAGQLIVIDPSTSTIVIKFSSGPSLEHDVYMESYAGAVAIIEALSDKSALTAPAKKR